MSFARQIVPGRTYLITRRCTQRQFLLRPDEETNNAFVYCYAYAAAKTGIDTVAFIANSNHYHAVVVDRLGQIPVFLELFHKLLAKHQNRLRGREENFWATQQTSLVELVDETDVLDKVIYTLCNPVKDHLVEHANEWPGATSLASTLEGKILRATRPARFFRAKGNMPTQVTLSCVRPPSLIHAEEREYRAMLSLAIANVQRDAADERKRRGFSVLGAKAILAQSPTDSPRSKEPRRELNPLVAAKDKGARQTAIEGFKMFRDSYAVSRDGWLSGMDVTFPAGTWWLRRFAGAPCVECFPPHATSVQGATAETIPRSAPLAAAFQT